MTAKKGPRIHVVRWKDAHYDSEETSLDDSLKRHKAAMYWSAGVLVESNEEGITLAMDYGLPIEEVDRISYRTKSFIPRVLIEEEFDVGSVIREVKKKKETIVSVVPEVI